VGRGEMAQTMYTHMNKCINNFLKKEVKKKYPVLSHIDKNNLTLGNT
jgi:hypothetical protein